MLHGRVIIIYNEVGIDIGYYENGGWRTGNYIKINSDGDFEVGECYLEDGR
jgi:hypothetical protein